MTPKEKYELFQDILEFLNRPENKACLKASLPHLEMFADVRDVELGDPVKFNKEDLL